MEYKIQSGSRSSNFNSLSRAQQLLDSLNSDSSCDAESILLSPDNENSRFILIENERFLLAGIPIDPRIPANKEITQSEWRRILFRTKEFLVTINDT